MAISKCVPPLQNAIVMATVVYSFICNSYGDSGLRHACQLLPFAPLSPLAMDPLSTIAIHWHMGPMEQVMRPNTEWLHFGKKIPYHPSLCSYSKFTNRFWSILWDTTPFVADSDTLSIKHVYTILRNGKIHRYSYLVW